MTQEENPPLPESEANETMEHKENVIQNVVSTYPTRQSNTESMTGDDPLLKTGEKIENAVNKGRTNTIYEGVCKDGFNIYNTETSKMSNESNEQAIHYLKGIYEVGLQQQMAFASIAKNVEILEDLANKNVVKLEDQPQMKKGCQEGSSVVPTTSIMNIDNSKKAENQTSAKTKLFHGKLRPWGQASAELDLITDITNDEMDLEIIGSKPAELNSCKSAPTIPKLKLNLNSKAAKNGRAASQQVKKERVPPECGRRLSFTTSGKTPKKPKLVIQRKKDSEAAIHICQKNLHVILMKSQEKFSVSQSPIEELVKIGDITIIRKDFDSLCPGNKISDKILYLAAVKCVNDQSLCTYRTVWSLPPEFAIHVPMREWDHWYLMVVDIAKETIWQFVSHMDDDDVERRRSYIKKVDRIAWSFIPRGNDTHFTVVLLVRFGILAEMGAYQISMNQEASQIANKATRRNNKNEGGIGLVFSTIQRT
ncbi:hypothetical protein PIB30_047678 [Stylosanthes scabra]|uniref:Ubiquitin-like protease family profile domain-containing protein n=1 Tax=Stylosanthes scabra TaxID=79078 RepID=A0ABU6YHW1_9FABA|nr:hypothetical protein [Stylosanthes scabra]